MIRTRLPGFLNAFVSKGALWLPNFDIVVPHNERKNVRGCLYLPTGEKMALAGANLVSDDGELHYAERIAGSASTDVFTTGELASATPGVPASTDDRSDYTMIATSEKVITAAYPKINDLDTDNTGKGAAVFTFKYEWSAADGNWATINGGIITNATPGATEAILTGFDFGGAISKDSSTALNLWVNHAPTGV